MATATSSARKLTAISETLSSLIKDNRNGLWSTSAERILSRSMAELDRIRTGIAELDNENARRINSVVGTLREANSCHYAHLRGQTLGYARHELVAIITSLMLVAPAPVAA